jgi:hypothetical protein
VQSGVAWSGSDSDADDPLALVGVSFEGAVSPGGSDDEGARELERRPG